MIEKIEPKELKGINKATEQIHTAAQFLSMAGEFLTERKKDGSHANLGWLSMKEKFITHPFGQEGEFVMELSPAEMEVTICCTRERTDQTLKLKGITQEEGVKWVKKQLSKLKVSGASKYKIAPPYELPEYAKAGGKKFKKTPKKGFQAFSKLRTTAEYFIQKHSLPFSDAEEPRTWPHHLDHASLVTLARLKNGEATKTMGLGLAIHDGMINEPYFYVSTWQKGKDLDLSKLEKLTDGSWVDDGYKGSVLKVSDVAEYEDSAERIDHFFTDSIAQILKLQKYKAK